MKIDADKLSIKVSIGADDVNKLIDEYKEDSASLIVEKIVHLD
jgi:hypothetical protein